MMKFLALLALALVPMAWAQGCLIQASDLASINLSAAAPVCSFTRNPSAQQCSACGCELFKAFWGTDSSSNLLFRRFDVSCDTLPDESSVTNAITPCANTVLPVFQRAGISLQTLLALRSCPRENQCISDAVTAQCPNSQLP